MANPNPSSVTTPSTQPKPVLKPQEVERLTMLVPIDEDVSSDDIEADTQLKALAAERKAKAAEVKEKADDTYVYYVKCRKGHADEVPPHGIYLKKNPGLWGIVKMNEWRSRTKPRFETACFEPPFCQVCFMQTGERQTLDIEMIPNTNGHFKVNPRWLYRYAKDVKRRGVEGEHRALSLGDSRDQGRNEAMARAAAAGLEVLP
jgi:hypothetical protein